MPHIGQILMFMAAVLAGLTACAPATTPIAPDLSAVLPLSKDRPTLVFFYTDA